MQLGKEFLPVTKEEMLAKGWEQPDFVVVSGDAYVDHPSFGHAIISRVLENAGYKVCMLNQPDFHSTVDFERFGRPKYGFMVAAGNIDSMVNHYTAAKKPRSEDFYSPGGKAGLRPDRATIVYCNLIHKAFPKIPIIIGGVEASLRRFAHYDYWSNSVRHSILDDAGADLLVYGMGETQTIEVANRLRDNLPLTGIPGTCTMASEVPADAVEIPSFMECRDSKTAYCKAFRIQYEEQDPIRGRKLAQKHEKKVLVAEKPVMPLSRPELDAVYALPYTRKWHPMYDRDGGVPALQEVEFSIASTRGCFGACNFCALTFHQGRIVQSRSPQSILEEEKLLTTLPNFKGYIHDVGGPTANFRFPACKNQLKVGACKNRQCLFPTPCKNIDADQSELTKLLRDMREVEGVKKVFVRSGLRFDFMMLDKKDDFFEELVAHHISGQLKVAPEHVAPKVLKLMGKPDCRIYRGFTEKYKKVNEKLGMDQYLVPYFISSHPGCDLPAAVELAEYLRDIGHQPEQVQDFIPTPGTLSTAMFYTGLNPLTFERVYVPTSPTEKAMQRALLQYKRPENHDTVRRALQLAGREDLIGFGPHCLVPPAGADYKKADKKKDARPPKHGGKASTGSKPVTNSKSNEKKEAFKGKNESGKKAAASGKKGDFKPKNNGNNRDWHKGNGKSKSGTVRGK